MNHKTTTFSRLFHSHASVSSCGVLGLFTDQNDRFPYPFIYLEPKIGTFFGRSHPVQGSTPPGEKQSIAFIKGSEKGFWSLWGVKMWASLGPFLNSQENVLEVRRSELEEFLEVVFHRKAPSSNSSSICFAENDRQSTWKRGGILGILHVFRKWSTNGPYHSSNINLDVRILIQGHCLTIVSRLSFELYFE